MINRFATIYIIRLVLKHNKCSKTQLSVTNTKLFLFIGYQIFIGIIDIK